METKKEQLTEIGQLKIWMEERFNSIETRLDSHDKAFALIRSDIREIKGRLDNHDKAFALIRSDIREIIDRLDNHDKTFALIRSDTQEVRGRLDNHDKAFALIRSDIREMDQKIDNITVKVEVLTQEAHINSHYYKQIKTGIQGAVKALSVI